MASATPSRWLFGAGWDLALGCGGAYLLVFALLGAAGDVVQTLAPFGLLPLVILVTGIPHYGATLLRVYERREDRHAYRVFAVWASLIVYAAFAVGVYEVAVGSALVTLYLTWSPWHYTGQNYGIAVLFLRRRGVNLDEPTKRLLYLSFALSYALAFLGIHAALAEGTYAPVSLSGSTYRLLRLGIPESVVGWALTPLVAGYLGVTGLAWGRLSRVASLRDLAPSFALAALQALWFSLPVLARWTGIGARWTPFDPSLSEYTFLWIAVGHSVQYLWVTTYYALARDPRERRTPYLGKTLLAGSAVWALPLFLFGPDLLGVRAQDAGLGLLVAAAVNLQHFILDGAIWKLRDGRIARVLLRTSEASGTDASSIDLGRWVRPAVATLGVAYLLATVVGTLEFEFGVRRATDPPDFARLATAAKRLRWVGRDHPDVHYNLGMNALREGRVDDARLALRRSIDLQDRSLSWVALGIVEQRSQHFAEARDAYEAALVAEPDNVVALGRVASVYLQLGEPQRARASLAKAVAAAPEREDLRERLERLDRGDAT